jgi:uncharacterized repeat protein (TIGR01451 family)
MGLNRILALPVAIGGIITGAAMPALGAASIPLPTHLASTGPVAIALHSALRYRPGAEDLYTVLVRNTGPTEVTDVPVMLALPPSTKVVGANAAGTAQYGGVVWTADVKPMQQVALRATTVAGNADRDVSLVAVTACAFRTALTRQVCAATLLPVARALVARAKTSSRR